MSLNFRFLSRDNWSVIRVIFVALFVLSDGFYVFDTLRNYIIPPDSVQSYMQERAGGADWERIVSFYPCRVENQGTTGSLIHAYANYDGLVSTTDMFYLLIFEYRGEYLPWSAVPAD